MATLAVWTFRLDLLQQATTRLFDRWGWGPASLVVWSIDLAGLHVHDISLFGGAIRVKDLALSYNAFQLISGNINQATITGARVTIGMTDDGLTVAGAPFSVSSSADSSSPMGGFRIDAVRIVDARVAIESPTGPLEATFSTDLAFSGADTSSTALAMDFAVPLAGATRTLHIVAPTLALSPADGGLRLRFDQAAMEVRDFPWNVDDLSGEIFWRSGRLTARLTSSRMTSTETPALIVPVQVTGDSTMDGSRIDFAVHAIAQSPSGDSSVQVDLTGHHDRNASMGRSTVTVGPIVFKTGGVQPRDIFPALAGTLPALSGSAALSGSLAWREDTVSPNLVLRLANATYEPEGVRLSQISGDIAISGLWPPVTRPNQVLTGLVEAGGLPPMKTTLAFQLLPKPALSIEAIRMDVAGGQISTSPFIVDPVRPALDTVIAFSQVDLAEFFKLVGVGGLDGSGRLDGTIPVKVTPGATVIRDGHLAASGSGVIRLDSGALPKQLTDAGESMTLVLQALADFHYDSLIIDLAGEAAGDGTIMLKLRGNNPGLLDGRPFHINISLQSNFDRLIDIALRSMEAAQTLLRRTVGSMRR